MSEFFAHGIRRIFQDLWLSCIFILLFPACLFAAGPGTTGAQVLNQAVGARVQGMGEAFTAVADDVSTLHYNPAGLTQINDTEISSMYLKGISDTFYGYLGCAWQDHDQAFGIDVFSLQGGDIELNANDGTSETLKAEQDYVLTAGYAYSPKEITGGAISAGAAIKVIRSTLLEKYSALAMVLDFGLWYHTPWRGLSVGADVQNVGMGMKYQECTDVLPLNFRLGLAYALELGGGQTITAALDEVNGQQVFGGLEYTWKKYFSLRAGYKLARDLSFSGACAGAGIGIGFVRLDYGIGLQGSLGLIHYISLGTSF